MVRPAKLYQLLLESSSRSIPFRDFIALITTFGFEHQRTKGSHQSYANPRLESDQVESLGIPKRLIF